MTENQKISARKPFQANVVQISHEGLSIQDIPMLSTNFELGIIIQTPQRKH